MYYDPENAGNVEVLPGKDLGRSVANQLVPTGIRTKADNVVDQFSAHELFEDGSLGAPGRGSMPDMVSRKYQIDSLGIPAGDIARNVTSAVQNFVKNYDYENRFSQANIRDLGGKPLQSYNEQSATPGQRPKMLRQGSGANYGSSLESLASNARVPYGEQIEPKSLIDMHKLLNKSTGLAEQNADALGRTLQALPPNAVEGLQVPQRATTAMKITDRAGLAVDERKFYDPFSGYRIHFDGAWTPQGLTEAVNTAYQRANIPRSQPAQIHPSQTNYQSSDGQAEGFSNMSAGGATGQFAGLADVPTGTTVRWKNVLGISALAAGVVAGLYYLLKK
jgi:hypothetical protein